MQAPTKEQNQLDPYLLKIADSFVRHFSILSNFDNSSQAKTTNKEYTLYCRMITLLSQAKVDKVVEMAKLLAIPWLITSKLTPEITVESNLLGFFKVWLRLSPVQLKADFIYRWAMSKNFLDIVKLMINDKRADITANKNLCIKSAIDMSDETIKKIILYKDKLKSLEVLKTELQAQKVAPYTTRSQNLRYLILHQKNSLEESEIYLKKIQNILSLLFQRALASKDNYQKMMDIAKNEGQLLVIQCLLAYEKLLKLQDIATNTAVFTELVKEEILCCFVNKGMLNGVKILLEDKPEQKYMETICALLKQCPDHMRHYVTKNYQRVLAIAIQAQNQDNIQFLCQYMKNVPQDEYATLFRHVIFVIRCSLNKGDQKTALMLIQNINLADPSVESIFLKIIFDLAIKKRAVETINFLTENYKDNVGDSDKKRALCLHQNVRFFEKNDKPQVKHILADNKNTLFAKNLTISTGSLPHDPVCEAGYYPLTFW